MSSRPILLIVLAAGAGCGTTATGQAVEAEGSSCVEEAVRIALPSAVRETSGIAVGRRDPSVLWTHNDSGDDAMLYGVDAQGALLGAMRVTGAQAVDWEDMEIAECDVGSCLYLADIGDNEERRSSVVVYRTPEPLASDPATVPATRLVMRYPGGPRDAEAIFVLPGERLFVVTKGRAGPVEVYAYPAPLRPNELVTLLPVLALTEERPPISEQVTGASASPDGRTVAVRTYTSLELYVVADGALLPRPFLSQSLVTLQEIQGEAVGLGDDGSVLLTSEGGRGNAPSLSRIRCPIPDPL